MSRGRSNKHTEWGARIKELVNTLRTTFLQADRHDLAGAVAVQSFAWTLVSTRDKPSLATRTEQDTSEYAFGKHINSSNVEPRTFSLRHPAGR